MRVLLATDGSTDALAAARWLRDFPLPSTASFRVLTVVALPSPSLGLPRVGELHAELDAEGRRLAGETAKLLGPRAAAAETRARGESVGGDCSRRRSVARRPRGRGRARARGRMKRLLLGSVSERVLRDARCPVLIVKRPSRA